VTVPYLAPHWQELARATPTTPALAVRIGETDLGDTGFIVDRIAGLLDGAALSRGGVAVPGYAGAVADDLAAVPVQRLRIDGTLAARDGATLRDRKARLADLTAGLLEVSLGDALAVLRWCVRVSLTVDPLADRGKTVGSGKARVSLELASFDPFDVDVDALPLALGATPAPVPVGTESSDGIIWLYGGTNPGVEYLSGAGALLGFLGFTVTLGSDEALEIDLGRQRIGRWTSGVRANGASLWTSGDFFALDPGDGSRLLGAPPRLGTKGGATGLLLTRRRWL